MKIILSVFFSIQLAFGACGASYLKCRQITIPARTGMAADLTSYVLNIHGTASWLAVTGSGGDIINTVAQTGGGPSISSVPADLGFYSDATCTTPIPYYHSEPWVSTTGYHNMRVLMGTLSKTSATNIWACYNKSGQTTFLGSSASTWPSSYKGFWDLTVVSGSVDAHDATTNANNGTVTGVTAATGSPLGAAANFSGSSQYIALGTSTTLDIYQDMTVSGWLYVADYANYNAIITRTTGGFPAPFDEYLGPGSGYLGLLSGSQASPVAAASINVPLTTWTHVAWVVSGNSFHYYQNGVENTNPSQNTVSSTHTAGGSGHIAYIGTREDFVTMFKGKMAGLSIQNAAMSIDKVQADYDNQSSPGTFYTIGSEQTGSGGTTVPRHRSVN